MSLPRAPNIANAQRFGGLYGWRVCGRLAGGCVLRPRLLPTSEARLRQAAAIAGPRPGRSPRGWQSPHTQQGGDTRRARRHQPSQVSPPSRQQGGRVWQNPHQDISSHGFQNCGHYRRPQDHRHYRSDSLALLARQLFPRNNTAQQWHSTTHSKPNAPTKRKG